DANTPYQFYLGALPPYTSHMAVAGARIYNKALSASQISQLYKYASTYATVGTTFDSTKAAFLAVGDSLTSGVNASSDAKRWPDQMFPQLTNGSTYQRSYANYGNPAQFITQWQQAAPSALLDAYYDANRPKNVLFFWCGTNDSPSPTSYANFKA